MILHSPTERGAIIDHLTRIAHAEDISVVSSGHPERIGADFAWTDVSGDWRGVQRKELSDLFASLDDGRLSKEIKQLNAHVVMPLLVIEGRLQLAGDTILTNRFKSNTISYISFQRRLLTLAHYGLQVFFASEARYTADVILAYYGWSQHADHSVGQTRPKPTNDWGKLSNRDWQVHLLQGLDGVGAKTANAILDTLGRCPLYVDATVQELMQVPGIGRATAHKILHSINGDVTATRVGGA